MNTITTDSFRQRINSLLREWHVPGWSIAVFNNHIIVSQGFGLASIEHATPATSNSIYDWASTSKSITAGAVGKLVEDGHFTWSSLVSELLPEDFVLQDPDRTSAVTVEDILSHRTGLPRHDRSYFGVNATAPDTPRSITRKLRNLPASAPLRQKWQYNNMMFTVASYLVEKVSGQSFESYINQHIFEKAGMTSSYLQPSAVLKAGQEDKRALPYIWRKETQTYELVQAVDQPEGQGAGLIQSTVDDFAKWVQCMMSKDPKLFNEATYDELVAPRRTEIAGTEEDQDGLAPGVSSDEYALGWETYLYRGHRYITHDGGETGFRSRMLYLPQKSFGMVMAGNCAGASMMNAIISKVLVDELLEVPESERTDWEEYIRGEEQKYDKEEVETLTKLRKELSGQTSVSGPAALPSLPLKSYTGTYHHEGYGDFTVTVHDGVLYIDASDRGMPFAYTFEHVKEDRIFISAELDREDSTVYSKAEFELDEAGKVTKMGLSLEPALEPDLLWFAKTAWEDSDQ